MKPSVLEFLSCPACRSGYRLVVGERLGEEIMEGSLICLCGSSPVIQGVPRLLPRDLHPSNWSTAKRFGEEWTQFSMLTDEYEKQFLSWIEPVVPSHFEGKTVLDLGCGKGRHILQAKKFGAKTVIGVDLSQAVDVAFQNVGKMDGVHIIQADIYHLPFKPFADYAYSIGVLHHTPEPQKSFQCMVDVVKPGGSVSTWVYGREGNGWIVYLLNPFRGLTSRLPLPATKAIAFVFAVVLQTALKLLYLPSVNHPRLAWLKRILPYYDYLSSIAPYSFRENFSIVFDHLLPEIAFYLRREEVEKWYADAKLVQVVISQRLKNSWRGFGIKPSLL